MYINLKICRAETEDADIITKIKTMTYRDEKDRFKPIDEKVPKWSLSTPFYSIRNHHFYEKAGYIKVGTRAEGTVFSYEKTILD